MKEEAVELKLITSIYVDRTLPWHQLQFAFNDSIVESGDPGALLLYDENYQLIKLIINQTEIDYYKSH